MLIPSPYLAVMMKFFLSYKYATDTQVGSDKQSAAAPLALRGCPPVVTSSSEETVYRCSMNAFALMHLMQPIVNQYCDVNCEVTKTAAVIQQLMLDLAVLPAENVTISCINAISNSSGLKQIKLHQTGGFLL